MRRHTCTRVCIMLEYGLYLWISRWIDRKYTPKCRCQKEQFRSSYMDRYTLDYHDEGHTGIMYLFVSVSSLHIEHNLITWFNPQDDPT